MPPRAPRSGSRRAPRRRRICADRRRVVVVDAAAERIGQQLLGERADEHLRPREQRLPQAGHAVEGLAVRQAARRVERRPSSPRVRQRPTASKFSSARPSGSMLRWHAAQTALLRCSAISSRIVCARPPGLVLLERRHVGRRRRRRRAEHVFQNPFAAAHRRGARGVRGHRQNAAVPEQPAALAVLGQRDAAEPVAVDVRNAVVRASRSLRNV